MILIFRETDGITGDRLTFGHGAIPDGSYLKRSGRTIVGDSGISGAVQHNLTTGKQGGQANEYYHLTAAEYGGDWGAKDLTTTGHVVCDHMHARGDNFQITFGAGDDAGIYYDDTNMLIVPDLAGTGNVVIGKGTAGKDYSLTFDGETNDGVLTWMEDEDYFLFGDTVRVGDATNYTEVAPDLSFAGTSRINWTKIAANGATVTGFTTASAVSDLQSDNDGNVYTCTEVAGGNNYLVVDFASVTAFNWVRILGYYDGNSVHNLLVQIEVSPFDGSTWHTLDSIAHQGATTNTMEDHSFIIPSDTVYINSGVVKVRILHSANTVNSHTAVFDEVSLYQ